MHDLHAFYNIQQAFLTDFSESFVFLCSQYLLLSSVAYGIYKQYFLQCQLQVPDVNTA